MIYLAIHHINGEIDTINNKIYTKREAEELYKNWGLIIIEIDLTKGFVKIWG